MTNPTTPANDRREVINPHDKITIDYSDQEAADLAVLVVGEGKYGIGGDDGLPLLLFGGHDEWCRKKYGKTVEELLEPMPRTRLIEALESMRLERERSSLSDPVGRAHAIAERLRKAEEADTSARAIDKAYDRHRDELNADEIAKAGGVS